MEFRPSKIGDLDQIARIAEDAKAFLRAAESAKCEIAVLATVAPVEMPG